MTTHLKKSLETKWVWLPVGLVVVVVVVMTAYFLNPLRTASWDPRARLLGVVHFRVASMSMAPTLQTGDVVIVSALSVANQPLQLGDVVAFSPPHRPEEFRIARVAGLPGNRVEILDGATIVDGQRLVEPYLCTQTLAQPQSLEMAAIEVPPASFFVLGDNRDNSEDSRYWGMAKLDRVIGRSLGRMVDLNSSRDDSQNSAIDTCAQREMAGLTNGASQ